MSEKTKIIFLDVDGVLNSNDWYVRRRDDKDLQDQSYQYPKHEFDPEAIKHLNWLTDETGAKIVFSSTWRLGRTLPEIQAIFDLVGITGQLLDATPSIDRLTGYTIPRGCEIDMWLDQHGFKRYSWSGKYQQESIDKSEIANYVIFDDDSDMLYSQREHFIQISPKVGLTPDNVGRARRLLDRSVMDIYSADTPFYDETLYK